MISRYTSRAVEAKALRAVNFSSSLIYFALMQTAVISFSGKGDNSFANTLSGVVFGGLDVVLDSISNERAFDIQ